MGVLSAFAFTVLLFLSSFITTLLIAGSSENYSSSWFIITPWDTFREVVRSAVCGLTDLSCDDSNLYRRLRKPGASRSVVPKPPPTLFGRFIRRLLLGIPTVGAGSMLGMLINMPFPIAQWIRVRFRRSNRNATDFTTLIFVGIVIIGALK